MQWSEGANSLQIGGSVHPLDELKIYSSVLGFLNFNRFFFEINRHQNPRSGATFYPVSGVHNSQFL